MRIGPYDRVRVCKLTAFVFADVFFKFKSEQVQSGTYLYEEIWSIKYYVDSPRQLEPTPTPREKKGTRVWVEYLCNSICVCVWGTMHLVLCTTYYVPVHSTMYYLPRTSYEVICTVASWYQRYYVRGTRYEVHSTYVHKYIYLYKYNVHSTRYLVPRT